MNTILQMRSGAPDKIMYPITGNNQFMKMDNTNLVSFTPEQVKEFTSKGYYILCADEGDIRHANNIDCDQSFIILPHTKDESGNLKVIDYMTYVPKYSPFYKGIGKGFGHLRFPKTTEYTIEDFENLSLEYINSLGKVAIKTTLGSGSRGVILIDPDRVKNGQSFRATFTQVDKDKIINHANEMGCNIIIQDMLPATDRLAFDPIIKDGEFIADISFISDPSQVETTWDKGVFIRNEVIDQIEKDLEEYICKEWGVVDGLIDIDGYLVGDEYWIMEINWRMSTCFFQYMAWNQDYVNLYMTGINFKQPKGTYKFTNYRYCTLYNDVFPEK